MSAATQRGLPPPRRHDDVSSRSAAGIIADDTPHDIMPFQRTPAGRQQRRRRHDAERPTGGRMAGLLPLLGRRRRRV